MTERIFNPCPIPVSPILAEILGTLKSLGFYSQFVGGAVRDSLMGVAPKDIDIEVFGVSYEQLMDILFNFGTVNLEGQKFGVIKFSPFQSFLSSATEMDHYDFSVPRKDNKVGIGHKDFASTFDPSITPKEAATRRDFTINSMAMDIDGTLYDYFGGADDLKKGILRHTSDAFAEDPLRVLRGMQFACRFDLTLDPETAKLCASISDQYETLAKERVEEEWTKWATKSIKPSLVWEYLIQTDWIKHFPEMRALINVPQDPIWHPEGDCDIHTGHVTDMACEIANRAGLEGSERAVLLFAALCHDFAKATTTEFKEKGGVMRWTAHGHEKAGGPMARAFLNRINIRSYIADSAGVKHSVLDCVVKLVENHMAHAAFEEENVSQRIARRLAVRLFPANVRQLTWLVEADASGRPPLPKKLPESAARMFDMAAAEKVTEKPQPRLIEGRQVMPYFDNKPGPHIGEVVKTANEAQLEGIINNENEATFWLENYLRAQGVIELPGA